MEFSESEIVFSIIYADVFILELIFKKIKQIHLQNVSLSLMCYFCRNNREDVCESNSKKVAMILHYFKTMLTGAIKVN